MRNILRALAVIATLLPGVASAQVPQFPQTLPAQTVVGRLGAVGSSGPAQAIPFATFFAQVGGVPSTRNINTTAPLAGGGSLASDLTLSLGTQSANLVLAGPSTGSPAAPGFRALVGADLPAPGATSLGGVKSLTCSTSNWFNTLSTAGAFGCSQPNFTDLAGTTSTAQIAASAVTYAKIQNVTASRLLGNPTGSAAAPSEITLGSTLAFSASALQTGAMTGDVTASANSFATTIAANAVTNAKMATMAATTVKANATGGTATPTDVTLDPTLGFSGTTIKCTTATASQIGCSKPDGTTITASAGVLTAVGSAATSVAVGTTTVTSGTSNGVLFDNAAILGNTAAGTQGQHLGANGSGVPTYKSGGWELINTLTASASATLDDTTSITSAYNEYEIVFSNLVAATGTVSAELLVHFSGAFQTTSYVTTGFSVAAGPTAIVTQPTTYIPMSYVTSVATGAPGVSGSVRVQSPSANTTHIFSGVTGYPVAGSVEGTLTTSGYFSSTGAIDGIRFLFSSGNITSGTVKIYGRL